MKTRGVGVRDAAGPVQYVSTYGPPCSSCECHDHTNENRQSQLLMGEGHVVFHASFFFLFLFLEPVIIHK